ncbi:MAG TPA: HAMP domain-containing sensor histidine kinase [Cyclobacteriaceae bacterium]|nr:HAMP domain-containing sensor histidine kinase [Cyclobacteriaceae bacterium]
MSRNHLPVVLMACSLALLLVLQGFWLRSAYQEAKDQFRKDASRLLWTTVFNLKDAMIQRNIQAVPGTRFKQFISRDFRDSIHSRQPMPPDVVRFFSHDSVLLQGEPIGTRVEIVYSGSSLKDDSLRKLLKPVIKRMNQDKNQKNFFIRLGVDSLAIKNIVTPYQVALDKAGLQLPFTIKRIDGPGAGFFEYGSHVLTEPVSASPVDTYVASFDRLEGYLLGRIKIEILFSLFLTMVTLSAFVVMYRSVRSQQRLVQLKNDFISNVTHELKTPIATVSVALEALQNFKGISNPNVTEEYLAIAQQELRRLTVLTDKVLTTSLFDENGVRIEPEMVSLGALVDSIVASLRLVFEKHGAHVELVRTGSNFELPGSSIHLTNVVHNLIDNALKYCDTKPHLVIGLRDAGPEIVLMVKDNGVGIPAAYQKKVFEKFFRMPTGDVHTIKGYGLGLSYVASVVHAHKGRIDLVSTPGEGSTFTIHLPRS